MNHPYSVAAFVFNEAELVGLFCETYADAVAVHIHDFGSTDDVLQQLAAFFGNRLTIIHHSTPSYDSLLLWQLKNKCWRELPTDWVVVVDFDELLVIDSIPEGASVIEPDYVHTASELVPSKMSHFKYGEVMPYTKAVLFNKSVVTKINYRNGSVGCSPVGDGVKIVKAGVLLHMAFVGKDKLGKKIQQYTARGYPRDPAATWRDYEKYLKSTSYIARLPWNQEKLPNH